MPELPEVQTTVRGLGRVLPGLQVKDVWTDWPRMFRGGFARFRSAVRGERVTGTARRGKHVLMHLFGKTTIIVHMKMTGHLLYGAYRKSASGWVPKGKEGPLADPFNRFIHVVFTLSNGHHLAFSDMRKFGRIALERTDRLEHSPHLAHLGPEPLEGAFTLALFRERLGHRPKAKVKQALMDQALVAGIGNIYSDEMLWRAGIHPLSIVSHLTLAHWRKLYAAMREVLTLGIRFGGDSTSDYRNVEGRRGAFQGKHEAYRRTGGPCGKRGCPGVILRAKVGGRSAHFCSVHQKKL